MPALQLSVEGYFRDFFGGVLLGASIQHVRDVIHISDQASLRAVDCRQSERRFEGGHFRLAYAAGASDAAQTALRDFHGRLAGKDSADRRQRRGVEAIIGLLVDSAFSYQRGPPRQSSALNSD